MPRRDWEAKRMKGIPFSGIRRIFQAAVELEREGKSVIHLEIGRPDFDTPQHIKDAASQALDDGFVHYTSNYGDLDLRNAIAEKLSRENGIQVAPDDEIIVTVGANEAILLTMLALLDPGDEVLIPDAAGRWQARSRSAWRGEWVPSWAIRSGTGHHPKDQDDRHHHASQSHRGRVGQGNA